VRRAEPSYTVFTLQHFTAALPSGTKIILLVGEDNLPQLQTWYDLGRIMSLAEIAVMPRPGGGPYDTRALVAAIGAETVDEILARRVPSPLIGISASEIRRRARDGLPIEGLVPSSVAGYIRSQGLYG
jgi:nicotinate-nucleotide adenylyltransferase